MYVCVCMCVHSYVSTCVPVPLSYRQCSHVALVGQPVKVDVWDSIDSAIGPLTCTLPPALFCPVLSLRAEWCVYSRERVYNTDGISGVSVPGCSGAMKPWRSWRKGIGPAPRHGRGRPWGAGVSLITCCPPRFKPESSSPLNVS